MFDDYPLLPLGRAYIDKVYENQRLLQDFLKMGGGFVGGLRRPPQDKFVPPFISRLSVYATRDANGYTPIDRINDCFIHHMIDILGPEATPTPVNEVLLQAIAKTGLQGATASEPSRDIALLPAELDNIVKLCGAHQDVFRPEEADAAHEFRRTPESIKRITLEMLDIRQQIQESLHAARRVTQLPRIQVIAPPV